MIGRRQTNRQCSVSTFIVRVGKTRQKFHASDACIKLSTIAEICQALNSTQFIHGTKPRRGRNHLSVVAVFMYPTVKPLLGYNVALCKPITEIYNFWVINLHVHRQTRTV